MRRKLPIFQSAMLLTGVNLILRGSGTAFRIYLSRQIGAEGIGLLQLVMSVGVLALVAGMAGIRTATMYLTAEELGAGEKGCASQILRGCLAYSLICSLVFGMALYAAAPWIAEKWIGNAVVAPALRLYSAFLPPICMGGVLTGYFTAERKVLFLSAVEIGEQVVSIGVTLFAIVLCAKGDALRACMAIIAGSGAGAVFCLMCLWIARAAQGAKEETPIAVKERILHAALPLAAGDLLRTGIGSAENLMVPKRLALNPGTANPVAAFGMMSGMVFPVVMFPACLLFGVCEILIPEMAACKARSQGKRIGYLVQRGLWASLLYGGFVAGLLLLCAEALCMRLYGTADAVPYIRMYAMLIPMLYCDAVTDACTKGLGQQRVCVRYNIITNALDVLFLFFLLPRYGLKGYFVSFFITHGLNFFLSIRRLVAITKKPLSISRGMITITCCFAGAMLCRTGNTGLSIGLYIPSTLLLLALFGALKRSDAAWLGKVITGIAQTDSAGAYAH